MKEMGTSERPILLFLKATFHHWWALMSCTAFTALGIWATYAEKNREWILLTSGALAVVFVLVSAYQAWAKEHQLWKGERQKFEMLTARPDVTIAVHGIFAHVAQGDQLFVILPDVTVANQSHGLRVALTADLWMLRSANMEGWCSPETKPVLAWEQSQHSFRHNILVLPLNLEPRSADIGYLAFSHRVLKGIGNEPLADEHGHWRYRIDFQDIHSNSLIYQQEIAASPHLTENG